jgi:hypothetical protein
MCLSIHQSVELQAPQRLGEDLGADASDPLPQFDRALGALARVRELVRDMGCEPVVGGGLERAGLLEATAALFIALWVGEEADVQAIAPPLAYAAGPSREQAEGGQRSFC